MNISGQPPASLPDSVLGAQTANTQIGVALLKKAQDSEKQQGAAMVKMLDKIAPQAPGQLLNALA